MNFWQIVMLMAWFAVFAMMVWAAVAVIIDVVRRDDVSGLATAVWIVFVLVLPVIGALVYVAFRPKLSRGEKVDVAAYESDIVPGGSAAADQIADLARLRANGDITDDEYQELKASVIG